MDALILKVEQAPLDGTLRGRLFICENDAEREIDLYCLSLRDVLWLSHANTSENSTCWMFVDE